MKIVVLDGYRENPGDLSWAGIEKFGETTVYDRTPNGDLKTIRERIGDAEIVVTNKTQITKEVLDACPSIRYITVLATGYNVVDTAYAKEKGIPVSNIPTYGTDSVAQFTIALLLELCHHIGHHNEAVQSGRWSTCPDFCFWDTPLIELAGKTMGIIGFGRIGHRVGQIAKALGMRVLVQARHCNEEYAKEGFEYTDLDTLLSSSDVISLHCPLTPETKGVIRKETIGKMKDGVLILNSSRGPLIAEEDLRDALESGKVAGAAVDVLSEEPAKSGNPLLGAKNCIITPHMAWAAKEARERIMKTTAENIASFLAGKPQNTVN